MKDTDIISHGVVRLPPYLFRVLRGLHRELAHRRHELLLVQHHFIRKSSLATCHFYAFSPTFRRDKTPPKRSKRKWLSRTEMAHIFILRADAFSRRADILYENIIDFIYVARGLFAFRCTHFSSPTGTVRGLY